MKFEWQFTKAPMADEVFYVFEGSGAYNLRKAIFSGSDVEDEARGRLIAAAPEMLEELQLLAKDLTSCVMTTYEHKTVERINKLIAKATGESK